MSCLRSNDTPLSGVGLLMTRDKQIVQLNDHLIKSLFHVLTKLHDIKFRKN